MERFIDAETVKSVLTYEQLIDVMENAVSKFSSKSVIQPVRTVLPVERAGG